jgi:DNA polymerase-3 subunit delta
MLLFRALQELPEVGYNASMSPALFQQQCLPRLKNNPQWKKELSGHPYAVYMKFKTASAFKLSTLKNWMALILQADFRLKGSPVASDTVISNLIINMLKL